MSRTLPLFPPELPEGFLYRPDFLSAEEEALLLAEIRQLDFQAFDFHGYMAKRRIVEYGWEYDFGTRTTSAAIPIPPFLQPLRRRVAAFAGVSADAFVEAVVTEYSPGAPIGWHRDVPQFEWIVGISLGSACRMRLKPYRGAGGLVSVILEPRSAYLMRDAARWNYQHSIPAVKHLRYSITFRTLREKRVRKDVA